MVSSSWQPAPGLRDWLIYGIRGVLMAALLSIASSALALSAGPVDGFHFSDALSLAALVPLGFGIAAYWKVSLAASAPGLRKSALGVYGTAILLQAAGLAPLASGEGELSWWTIGIWIVVAIAMLILAICVWNLEGIEKDAAKKEAAKTVAAPDETKVVEESSPAPGASTAIPTDPPIEARRPAASGTNTAKGAAGGGCAVLGLILAKVLLKLPFLAALSFGPILAIVAVVGVFGLAVIFRVWFAVAKVRLAGTLGGLAALVGITELLLLLSVVAAACGMGVEMINGVVQAGGNDKAMEEAARSVVETWFPRVQTGEIIAWGLWGGLTAALFLKVRSLCPAPDAFDDEMMPITR